MEHRFLNRPPTMSFGTSVLALAFAVVSLTPMCGFPLGFVALAIAAPVLSNPRARGTPTYGLAVAAAVLGGVGLMIQFRLCAMIF